MRTYNSLVITPRPYPNGQRFNSHGASDTYLCLALTEEQLHTCLDEFRVCNEFEDDCSTVSSAQQILRMVNGNDTDRLSNSLRE
jgi:hypothetical protein